MCEYNNEAHNTAELGTNDYLAWLAMEKQRINAIRLAYIRDKISKGTYEDALGPRQETRKNLLTLWK